MLHSSTEGLGGRGDSRRSSELVSKPPCCSSGFRSVSSATEGECPPRSAEFQPGAGYGRVDDLQGFVAAVEVEAVREALERERHRRDRVEAGEQRIASRIAAGVAEQEPTSVSSRRRICSKSSGAASVSQEKTSSVPPGSSASERPLQARVGAENGGVHGPVGGLGAVAEGELEPVRQRVRGEHVVPASDERLDEEEPGEAAADHEHPSARDALDRAQDAGERLGEGAGRVVDLVGKGNRLGRERALGEAAWDDRRRRGTARRSSRARRGSARTRRRAGGGRARRAVPPRPRQRPRGRARCPARRGRASARRCRRGRMLGCRRALRSPPAREPRRAPAARRRPGRRPA